jgi:hypothetical protein
MSFVLRRAAARTARSLHTSSVAKAGDLPVHPNPFLEQWGLRREHIEDTFYWTPRTLATIALVGVVVPVSIYKVGVAEFVRPRACCVPSAFSRRSAKRRQAERRQAERVHVS